MQGFQGIIHQQAEALAEIDVMSINVGQACLELEVFFHLVLEEGIGQIELQFILINAVQVQEDFFLEVLMNSLLDQALGHDLEIFQLPLQLLYLLPAIVE